MSKLFAVVVSFVLALSVAVGGDKILVGTNAEFMPFEFTDDNNQVVGYDIDVIHAVGRAAGLEVAIHNQNFDTLVESLNSGKVDAVISGMTITPEREKVIDFTEPYYNAAQVIVVLDSSTGFTSMDQLKDKSVGVQLGTTGALMAEEALGKESSKLKQFRKFNEVFAELRFRRIDAVVVDLPVAQAYLRKLPGLKITSEPMSEEYYGIAVKKGNTALLAKLNAGLEAIRASGEFDEITNKWFQD